MEAADTGRVAGLIGAMFKLGLSPLILHPGPLADIGHLRATFALAALIDICAAAWFPLSFNQGANPSQTSARLVHAMCTQCATLYDRSTKPYMNSQE